MGNFRAEYIFSDGCVLQRYKPIAVFGYGDEGEKVTVTLDGDSADTFVSKGKWKVCLKARKAGKNLTMTITHGAEEITFTDVAVGEVWLAGGQSNMEFELQNAVMGREMLETDSPDVRFYYTPKIEWEDDEKLKHFEMSRWKYFGPESAANWSAVGYMFAKRLFEELSVTVGVIGCNWGGTSASCWVPEEDLKNGWEDTRTYLTDYLKGIEGKSLEEQKKEYLEYLEYRAEWEPKCEALYKENPMMEFAEVESIIGPSRYPGPVNSYNPMRPAGLYEIMVKRVIEYSMAGVIFYQGESDDHKPDAYFNLFNMLIDRWRKDNGDLELPFLAVSLPMHRYRQDPDYKHWPRIRANQRKVVKNKPETGLCVAIDCGQFDDIHPKDKRVVAERLYKQAMSVFYGKLTEDEANGPIAYSVRFDTSAAVVKFDHAADGFLVNVPHDDKPKDYKDNPNPLNLELKEARGNERLIKGFEIAPMKRDISEEDFVPAEVKILPGGTIKIFSDKINNPGAVRYLWTNWGEVTLYGKNGIPVEPFRA